MTQQIRVARLICNYSTGMFPHRKNAKRALGLGEPVQATAAASNIDAVGEYSNENDRKIAVGYDGFVDIRRCCAGRPREGRTKLHRSREQYFDRQYAAPARRLDGSTANAAVAPGAYAIVKLGTHVFHPGGASGSALELLAEDGDPAAFVAQLKKMKAVRLAS